MNWNFWKLLEIFKKKNLHFAKFNLLQIKIPQVHPNNYFPNDPANLLNHNTYSWFSPACPKTHCFNEFSEAFSWKGARTRNMEMAEHEAFKQKKSQSRGVYCSLNTLKFQLREGPPPIFRLSAGMASPNPKKCSQNKTTVSDFTFFSLTHIHNGK